jgi:hypothetical protein
VIRVRPQAEVFDEVRLGLLMSRDEEEKDGFGDGDDRYGSVYGSGYGHGDGDWNGDGSGYGDWNGDGFGDGYEDAEVLE